MKFSIFSSSAFSAPLRFVKYTLISASVLFFVGYAIAPIAHKPTPANAQLIGEQPPPPPKKGTPGGTQTGGGTRPGDSKCPSVNTPVIAFMPAQGNTTQESPTFWFYVPYSAQQVDSFTFVLMDDKGQLILPPKNIKLSATPGFISLRLPPTSKPLEIGKQYRWYFEIFCDAENPEDKIDSQGVLRRIAPTFTMTNQTAIRPLIEQYQNNGLTLDAFNLLAEQRRKEPNNPTVIADWNQMMRSLGHSNIATQPIVSCCSLE